MDQVGVHLGNHFAGGDIKRADRIQRLRLDRSETTSRPPYVPGSFVVTRGSS